MRAAIAKSFRAAITAAILIAIIAAMSIPWSQQVTIPAIIEAEGIAAIYPPIPARVKTVHVRVGEQVERVQLLVTFDAPALDQELHLTNLRAEIVALRQSRRASDPRDREAAVILDQEHSALIRRRDGLRQQMAELGVRAPIAGEVVELMPSLNVGRWLSSKQPAAVVRSPSSVIVSGMIEAGDVWRVQPNASARFVPDDLGLKTLAASVTAIALSNSGVTDKLELSGSFGGRIPDTLDSRRQPVPISAQYTLRAKVEGPIDPRLLAKTVPGLLLVDGLPESFLARTWRQALKVLVRESRI